MPEDSKLGPPLPLSTEHLLTEFSSGESTLDRWLKQRAMRNERSGSSRTYVVSVDNQVIAYYYIATGSISQTIAPSGIRRNSPDPIPIMVLGRLAVDSRWQNKGIGKALLRDAILRTVQVSEIAGVKALLVHALSKSAAEFYEAHGFHQSPNSSGTLFLPLSQVD